MDLPSINGNWVDMSIFAVILLYLWGGWSRGFILGSFDLLGFLFSFFSAIKFYTFFSNILVDNFSLSRGFANALGFFLAGIIAEILYSTILGVIVKKIYPAIVRNIKKNRKLYLLFKTDKFLGFIPAIGEALIFTAFILTLFVSLPIAGSIKKDIISAKAGGVLVSNTQGIERQLNLIFGAAVNETLNFITVNPNLSSQDSVNLGFTQKEVKIDESSENTMFFLVNQEREKEGLKKLEINGKLRDLARKYGKEMFAGGFFSHYNLEGKSPFDRMGKEGIEFLAAGENLALAPNVFLAHQGLMNSPGHKANILHPDFGKIGIGVIDGGIYGMIFVQEFSD